MRKNILFFSNFGAAALIYTLRFYSQAQHLFKFEFDLSKNKFFKGEKASTTPEVVSSRKILHLADLRKKEYVFIHQDRVYPQELVCYRYTLKIDILNSIL